ncbi:hypothetical protein KSP39_PZI020797 [Platanthera zijinensis]|uniref:Reverse transcriptase Ty1/copia-type domain-containing protein n=1 Tax=Platanthera zijinensis TaxID=2320716 RepID=A0AAP0AYW8_9ASPA
MDGGRSPAAVPKSKFSVYQNPTLSAALTAASLRPSAAAILLIFSGFLVASITLLTLSFREEEFVKRLAGFHISNGTAFLLAKILQSVIGFVFLATVSAIIRSLPVLNVRKTFDAYSSKKTTEKQTMLTDRQLQLLGLNAKSIEKRGADSAKEPSKSRLLPSRSVSEALVPIRKTAFSYTPRSGAGRKTSLSLRSLSSMPYKYAASPSTPWSRHSPVSAKGILTEERLEEFLADVDEKIMESEVKSDATPPPTVESGSSSSGRSLSSETVAEDPLAMIRKMNMKVTGVKEATAAACSGGSGIGSALDSSGATDLTSFEAVDVCSILLKVTPPPDVKDGHLEATHPPASREECMSASRVLGTLTQAEGDRELGRQRKASELQDPVMYRLRTRHGRVMQAASNLGANITVNQIGCDSSNTIIPVNVSPVYGMKDWQPTVTLDEDGFLHQIYTSLAQARDGLMSISSQQPQQIALLPLIQQCLDSIIEHQRLKTLMKGEIIKGLLPQSTVPANFTFQRVRELAEGTCLKNFDYIGSGDGFDKAGKKLTADVPSDSHLLLYLFCSFLEHPKWMLHVDPTSYSGSQSNRNPLFLGVLPPKDKFPEKYVAVISGVPYIMHPGASVLSIGKQRPPIFCLYWDKKLQFSLQGRTALWDAILLLCHRIKVGYCGIVRGVHLDYVSEEYPGHVCKLKKALYGLKQAPRAWYGKIAEYLQFCEYFASDLDSILFVKNQRELQVLILLYVDDMIFTGNSKEEVARLMTELAIRYEMKDLGELHHFLELEVERQKNGVLVSQKGYAERIVKRFSMGEGKSLLL